MKKIKLIVKLLLLLALTGCASYMDTTAKGLSSVAITVDSSMKGWAQWVKMGKATVGDEAKVQAAYEKYQAAMATAESAYLAVARLDTTEMRSALNVAVAALDGSKGDLINLIKELMK